MRLAPVEMIEVEVAHLTKPEHVQNQRVTRQILSPECLSDGLQLVAVAVSVARLEQSQSPAWRKRGEAGQFQKRSQQTWQIRSVPNVVLQSSAPRPVGKYLRIGTAKIPHRSVRVIHQHAVPA